MGLIHLPQAKWGSGTGRQVILKGDFDKIEQGLLESFEFAGGPALAYVDTATLRVSATPDCKARVMLCGFPSPLHRDHWLDVGLSDGRYRENAAAVDLNLPTACHHPGHLDRGLRRGERPAAVAHGGAHGKEDR